MKVYEDKSEVLEVKKFKPFKFKLDIETEDDLYALWHMFNSTESNLKDSIDKNSLCPAPKQCEFYDWWIPVDQKLKELGLREVSNARD